MVDELIYSELAKSFAEARDLLIRDRSLPYFTLYSVFVSPAWLADDAGTALRVAKGMNAVLMSLVAVPVYFWGRRLAGPGLALVAAVLTLAMPPLLYTGMVMTENAFLPAFVAAMFALATALERPTLARQAIVLGAVALACAIRLQGVVLVAVVATAIVAKVLLDVRAADAPSRRRVFLSGLRSFTPTLGTLGLAVVGYVAVAALRGRSLATGLGAYETVTTLDYSLMEVLRWSVYHLGELMFAVGVVPACAFVILSVSAAASRGRVTTPSERAFVATVGAAVIWLVAVTGAFASVMGPRIQERNVFYLAPLLFLALVLWLARGAERPVGATVAATILPVALLVPIPFERLVNETILSDTFGFIPLLRVSTLAPTGMDDVRLLVAAGVAAACVLTAALPPRIAIVALPAAVFGFLALSSYSVLGSLRVVSQNVRGVTAVENPSWIDDRIGRSQRAAFVYTGALPNPNILWQTELWNRSLGDVLNFGAREPLGHLPSVDVTVAPATGRFVDVAGSVTRPAGRARYVVADASVPIAGTPIARTQHLTLHRIDPPLRLSHRTAGVYPDGWTGPRAFYTQYAGRDRSRRTIGVTLSRKAWSGPDVRSTVTVAVARIRPGRGADVNAGPVVARRRLEIHRLQEKKIRLRAPPPPFRVAVTVEPTFSPAQFGAADSRQLGVQVAFGR